jgi:hypothetical protein
MQCARAVEGLPTAYIQGETNIETEEGRELEQYLRSWEYEALEIGVTDVGVSGFEWRAPLEFLEKRVENSVLLPFSEIQDIFERMLRVTYEIQAEGSKMTLEIKDVRLEMMRVVEQGSVENGLLIPVWNFYGIRHREFKNGEIDSTICHILLCVNAIDGSIIDTTRVY